VDDVGNDLRELKVNKWRQETIIVEEWTFLVTGDQSPRRTMEGP
jgi:hypothetical protein